ncbi:hypothetical protein BDEG_27695 [Batrachochytrium dendrobatidis JEL423]|uniref:Uncharacterized protein n=1 Tax=Batrachochytrium dendrobatidis (strain JEL423) TaxID=403673 RepID=A0A177WYK9_BATDL|nr:hypothetical protein BDEG_27695 [Batrachochytrium dendrobatidis JEL423]
MCFLSIDAENLFDSLRKTRTGSIIEFGDPKAVRELTCALLFKYFGLRLEIPLDSLCPPVPNRYKPFNAGYFDLPQPSCIKQRVQFIVRLDYILHIEDLLSESNPSLDATIQYAEICIFSVEQEHLVYIPYSAAAEIQNGRF